MPDRSRMIDLTAPFNGFINIALLLVLFFLVAGTIVEEEELGISPPEVMERPDTRLPRPLLAMTNEGQFLLDGVPVTDPGLVEAARAAHATPAYQEALVALDGGAVRDMRIVEVTE